MRWKSGSASRLSRCVRHRPVILDGSFEGTGVISGAALIEVADLDEALQLATTWPLRWPAPNVVEIRPLVEREELRATEKSAASGR